MREKQKQKGKCDEQGKILKENNEKKTEKV